MRSNALLWLFLMIAGLLAGCASTARTDRITTPDALETRDEVVFWNDLIPLSRIAWGDAVHAMLLFADGEDTGTSYEQRVSLLQKRKLLPEDFRAMASDCVDRGSLARFIVMAVPIPTGINATIFGVSGRYAIRELEFRELLPPSSPNQLVSGPELIGILARARDYQEVAGLVQLPVPQRREMGVNAASGDGSVPALLAGTALMLADLPATSPSTAAALRPARFVITELSEKVRVKRRTDAAFIPAVLGMELDEESEIATGLRAALTLTSEDGQTIRVQKMTLAKLRIVRTEQGVNVTRIDMNHGRIGAEVDEAAVEGAGAQHDIQVSSPKSTLAIKGTRVALYDQRPYTVEATSYTGTAVFSHLQRQKVSFGRKGGGTVVVNGNNPDPTAVALLEAVSDPGPRGARSDSEGELVANLISRGSSIGFDRFAELPVVTGGTVPQSAAEFVPFLTPGLNLAISWSGTVNVNLAVFTPPNNALVYPYGKLANSAGRIPFDHRGGPNGGFEIANLPFAANGHYTLLAQNLGPQATTVQYRAFDGSQPLVIRGDFDGETFPPIDPAVAIVEPGGTVPFEVFFREEPPDQGIGAASVKAKDRSTVSPTRGRKAEAPAASKPTRPRRR